MADVFVLYFTGPDSGGHTVGRFLGVFSSQANAVRAAERLQRRPGYRHHSKGFQVEAIELDLEIDLGKFGPPPPQPLPPPD